MSKQSFDELPAPSVTDEDRLYAANLQNMHLLDRNGLVVCYRNLAALFQSRERELSEAYALVRALKGDAQYADGRDAALMELRDGWRARAEAAEAQLAASKAEEQQEDGFEAEWGSGPAGRVFAMLHSRSDPSEFYRAVAHVAFRAGRSRRLIAQLQTGETRGDR